MPYTGSLSRLKLYQILTVWRVLEKSAENVLSYHSYRQKNTQTGVMALGISAEWFD